MKENLQFFANVRGILKYQRLPFCVLFDQTNLGGFHQNSPEMRGATGDTANDFVQSILQATRLEQKQHALPDAQLGCYFCIIL